MTNVVNPYGSQRWSHPVDAAVAQLAGRQHGVVSVAQLRSLGLTAREIQRRREAGWLHVMHRAVYAVGHRPRTLEARYMAAVLAVPGAVLSHRSAAALYGFWSHDHGAVDVTSIRKGNRRPGIRRHWTRSLDAHEVTTRHGIPVTTPARTATDLADGAAPNPYELALRSAERMGLLDRAELQAIHGRRGAGRIRARQEPTRSPLESALKALLARAGLPLPEFNAVVGGRERDAVWPERRLVVEVDGYTHHSSRDAFRRDRERDAELVVAGWRVVRFTYHQVVDDPGYVAAILRDLLR